MAKLRKALFYAKIIAVRGEDAWEVSTVVK